MKYENFPGVYELESILTDREGVEVPEKSQFGMFTFTRDLKLSVVSASDIMVMAYAGTYTIQDEILKIFIKSSVYRDMENTEVQRMIKFFDGKKLILEAVGKKSGLRSILTWSKTVSL
jgi:hypothetical protein